MGEQEHERLWQGKFGICKCSKIDIIMHEMSDRSLFDVRALGSYSMSHCFRGRVKYAGDVLH